MSNEDRKKLKQFTVKFSIERLAEFTVATRRRGITRASIIHNAVADFTRKEAAIDSELFAKEVEDEIKTILSTRSPGKQPAPWKVKSATKTSKGEFDSMNFVPNNKDTENAEMNDEGEEDEGDLPELPTGSPIPSLGEDDVKSN